MSSEWVAAIAAIWAAVATTWAAIATTRAVAATRKAPVDAAHIAASLQEASENRRLKLWVFTTVMQNRHFIGETEAVKALNVIDSVFHDSPAVRDSWANLYSALNDPRNFPPTGPTPIIDERRTALLSSMAAELGLIQNFRPDDFARVYLPKSILAQMQIRDMQQRAALNALSGQSSVAASVSPPVPLLFPPPPAPPTA
jgi:hypothetical protein